jgi:hypothetical protein
MKEKLADAGCLGVCLDQERRKKKEEEKKKGLPESKNSTISVVQRAVYGSRTASRQSRVL